MKLPFTCKSFVEAAFAAIDTLKDIVRGGIRIVGDYEAHLHRPLADIGEDLIEAQAVLCALFRFLAGETVLAWCRRRFKEIESGAIEGHVALRASNIIPAGLPRIGLRPITTA